MEENIVRKGEIACYSFSSYIALVRQNAALCVKGFTLQLLMTLIKKPLEDIVGKGENAGKQLFLLSLQCFLAYHREKSSLTLSSASPFNFVSAQICCLLQGY